MRRDVLFLDFCGVIYDCGEELARQWQALLGDFLAPRLGAQPAAWAAANAVALEHAIERYRREPPSTRGPVRDYQRRDDMLWLADMCEQVGLPMPEPARALALAEEAAGYVTARVRPTIPENAQALRELHRRGYALHTAANPRSSDLEGYLHALGVRELFGNLYGPDLVDTWKDGPAFYRAISAHAGVPVERAIVVEDNAAYVDAARAAGMRAVTVSPHAASGDGRDVVRSLRELTEILD